MMLSMVLEIRDTVGQQAATVPVYCCLYSTSSGVTDFTLRLNRYIAGVPIMEDGSVDSGFPCC